MVKLTDLENDLVQKICKNVNSPLRPQIETMTRVVLSLQKQLDENYDKYLNQPLSLEVTVGTGEVINRANPFVQEYRALFKDYVNSLKQLKELIDDVSIEEEINSLASIKDRLKIAK